jgi:indole-3-glycerol phosphate synthase
MTILDKIIQHKKKEVAMLPNFIDKKLLFNTKSLVQALSRIKNVSINIIAEVKQASPLQGKIRSVNPVKRAQAYEKAGVNAISCLTDEKFFQGSCQNLASIARVVTLPIIRKDFIFTKNQIAQARYYGAASYLLMVEVIEMTGANLSELIKYGRSLGMEALVETSNAESITKALQAGAQMIGVNSRNFKKEGLPIEFERFSKLLPLIPQGIIRVAESGFSTAKDLQKVSDLADAVLIGTVLMQQENENLQKFILSLHKK